MTMLLRKGQTIAGVPVLKIRDALNFGIRHECFTSELFREICKVSDEKAIEIAQLLLADGYLESVGPPHGSVENQQWYAATRKGITLANATGMPRMSREKGTTLLASFLQRVAEVNDNPDYIYSVATVIVYGSYVRGESTIGDLDIACELKPRTTNENELRRLCRERIRLALEKGRSFRNITDEVLWPKNEVRLHLKARTRGLNLHDLQDFFEMEKDSSFEYKVLFGDAEAVARKLV